MASGKIDEQLRMWYLHEGLQTIALSVVHYDQDRNREIYCHEREHYNLSELIKKLHGIGYSVRLCVMLLKGYIDSSDEVLHMLEFAHENEVEQLTLRSITVPEQNGCKDDEVFQWTMSHQIPEDQLEKMFKFIKVSGTKLMELSFGAVVYGIRMDDGKEQNVCLSNCLTETDSEKTIRQLIFFPEDRGRIGYSWQHEAATIM